MKLRTNPMRSAIWVIVIYLLGACEAINPSIPENPTWVPTPEQTPTIDTLPTIATTSPIPTLSSTAAMDESAVTPTATRPIALKSIARLEPGQVVTIEHIAMFTSNAGWAIGGLDRSADHILLTQDGGSTWLDRTPPASLPVEFYPSRAHAFFLDLLHAWVTYSGSSDVWFTTDGGQSWQSGPSGYAHARQDRIFFSDPDHGWLLRSVEASMGNELVALYRTVDGGSKWELLIDPYKDETLQGCLKTGMAFSGTEVGWITYDCQGTYPEPFIALTQDGGETWSTSMLPIPEGEPIHNPGDYCSTKSPVLFSIEHGALIVACVTLEDIDLLIQHILYLTQDGGTTWKLFDFPGENVLFLDDQRGFALGRELYYSADAGQSWRKVKVLTWDGQFSFVDEAVGWAVATAEDAVALVFTDDGGRKWMELKPKIAQP